MKLDLNWAKCRYLGETDGGPQRFTRLANSLGIEIPRRLSLCELAARGWLQPRLRVRLPTEFLLAWTNFPSYPREAVAEEHGLPAKLWGAVAFAGPNTAGDPSDLSGPWFTHSLDSPSGSLARWVAENKIPPNEDPPTPICHPSRKRPVRPWIDFYAYWQVYELAEVLGAASLSRRLWLDGDETSQLEDVAQEVGLNRDLLRRRLDRIREAWLRRAAVFEWISRYATARGIWASFRAPERGADEAEYDLAAVAIFNELRLDLATAKESLRDELLVLWRRWRRSGEKTDRLTPLQRLLQHDLALAVEFLRIGSGETVELDDPTWSRARADRVQLRWTPLSEALPYEVVAARDGFAETAAMYFDGLRPAMPAFRLLDIDLLSAEVSRWWPHSVALRRLAVAFARLHGHLGQALNADNLVGLREATPIEYLNLSALHVERLLSERLGDHSLSTEGSFHQQVRLAAERVAELAGFDDTVGPQLAKSLKTRANLRNLPSTRTNPFDQEYKPTTQEQLIRVFVNYAIMRNYAAHHDCIDWELEAEGWAKDGAEAIVAVAILVLDALPPKDDVAT